MIDLIFVHGTGVRQPVIDALKRKVEAFVANRAQTTPTYATVHTVDWGTPCGTKLGLGGAAIPEYDTSRAGPNADASDAEIEAATWLMLEDDPLFEFRLLGLSIGDVAIPPGAEAMREAFVAPLEGLALGDIPPDIVAVARALHVDATLASAIRGVLDADEVRVVLSSSDNPSEHGMALARAIVATAARMQDTAHPGTVPDGLELRFQLAGLLADRLNAARAGVKAIVADVLKKVATSIARKNRRSISDFSQAPISDILHYQARGDCIRGCIESAVRQARLAGPKKKLALIGHSLGGIACVDLCVSKSLEIDLLVTVGSQAPMLYETNALVSLPFNASVAADQRLPLHFPEWLNIWDPKDFLSYLAAPVFGKSRVEDMRVDNKRPFPDSHSAYFDNKDVLEAILVRL